LFDLADRLRVRGWQVPAYSLPPNRQDLAIQRVLVRHDFSRDLADLLLDDLRRSLRQLSEHSLAPPLSEREAGGFRH
jgi:glutamate decarboxylase